MSYRDKDQAYGTLNNHSGDADEIDLVQLLQTLWVSRRVVAFFLSIGMVLSVSISLILTPIFRAQVVMAPNSAQEASGMKALGQLGGLAALAGVSLPGENKVDEALAVLKSRAFIQDFIQERDLLPVLFEKYWNEKKQQWKVTNSQDIPTLEEAYTIFDEKIMKVSKDVKTGIVTLKVEWKDPVIAAAWANALVYKVNEEIRRKAILETQKKVEFLRHELNKTNSVEVKEAIYGLMEAQMKEAMLANVSEEYAFRVIDPAFVPEKKAKPKRVLICIAGTFVSALLGVFFVFGRKFYKTQIEPALR